ncbi:VWA domain-containing protein [Streptococcus himalayensis]|uniref:VWA domain-containing protein n=1 Tax=Streptococcus himalayensis TaxID=1888195 RepID=A0A917A7P5_9STRE|nr:VWA domain-containing protein [Streptococcus himalayensis]GGE32268.1 hypothetical protein GCM10011510_11960 [Streptococcus himalayensis]
MEKTSKWHKKRTGQWVCMTGLALSVATIGAWTDSELAFVREWTARTVEMVKKDLAESEDSTVYIIKWGDTLSVISEAVKIDMKVLVELNKISNVDLIYEGNKLYFSKHGNKIIVDNGNKAIAYIFNSNLENIQTIEQVEVFDSGDSKSINKFLKNEYEEKAKNKTPIKSVIKDGQNVMDGINNELSKGLSSLVPLDTLTATLPVVHEEILSEKVVSADTAASISNDSSISEKYSSISANINHQQTHNHESAVLSSEINFSGSQTSATETTNNRKESSETILEGNSTTNLFNETTEINGLSESTEVINVSNEVATVIDATIKEDPVNKTVASNQTILRTVRVTEEIPSEIIVTEDSTLPSGEVVVVSAGQSGKKVSIQEVKIVDGVEASRTTISEISKVASPTYVKVGTKGTQTNSGINLVNSTSLNNLQKTKDTSTERLTKPGYSETYFTEIVTKSNATSIRQRQLLEELTKNLSFQVDLSKDSLDKIGAIKVITKYDETRMVSDQQITNIEAAFVTGTVRKKISEPGKEDKIETLISKEIPQYIITVTLGTRLPGVEGIDKTGQLISISNSDNTTSDLSNVKVFESIYTPIQNSPLISNPIFIHSTDKTTNSAKIGLQFKRPKSSDLESKPVMVTINEIDNTITKVKSDTEVYGDVAYATISDLDKGKNVAVIWENKTLATSQNQPVVSIDPSKIIKTTHDDKIIKSLALSLVIDSSGSMEDYDPHDLRKKSASNLLNLLNLKEDLVSIVDFDSSVRNHTLLLNNKEDLNSHISAIDSIGGTNIWAGLDRGIRTLIGDTSERNKVILLFTDGQDSYYHDYSELTKKAKEKSIKIFTMGLGHDIDVKLLREIAENTDGYFFELATDTSIREAFSDITTLLGRSKQHGYEISTSSTIDDSDGDGYDDALEKRKSKDKFNQDFDFKKWNVGPRDLLLLSAISYLSDDTLKTHSNKFLADFKNLFQNNGITPRFDKFNLDLSDKRFFESWKLIGSNTDEYDKYAVPFHSSVSWFYNENSKSLVIAYRGTDENNDDFSINSKLQYRSELIMDLKIALNSSKVEEIAKKQIGTIIDSLKHLDVEKVYITGHSLGAMKLIMALWNYLRAILQKN